MTQDVLFEGGAWWEDAWQGMPEFIQEDQEPFKSIGVEVDSDEDFKLFGKTIGQDIPLDRRRAVWYPEMKIVHFHETKYVTDAADARSNPRYPVYVISKGRWEDNRRLTIRVLEETNVPHKVVVEPQEFEQYAAVMDSAKILVLPFSNLGLGSIPARNWVWEDSIKTGAARHWIIDDNIWRFYRLNRNAKNPVASGAIFRAMEDFVDRYENVALAGPRYEMFVPRRSKLDPFMLNTRIYSTILIDNALPYRWRGRYNEDTDLSLRALKDGWCTMQFNAFLANKVTTMVVKGGNTDELYAGDGRRRMAESLREQHPDIVKVTQKWGRVQHHVDYHIFDKNKPRLRPGAVVSSGADEYGMRLVNGENI